MFLNNNNNNNNNNNDNKNNDNNNDDLLTDPLNGPSLLNYLQIKLHYINYNYKINQIKLFTNYAAPTGLTVSSKIN